MSRGVRTSLSDELDASNVTAFAVGASLTVGVERRTTVRARELVIFSDVSFPDLPPGVHHLGANVYPG